MLFIFVVLFACGGKEPEVLPGKVEGTVSIGIEVPFEEPLKEYGFMMLAAARMKVKEVNEARGIAGIHVELMEWEDVCEGPGIVQKARGLANEPGLLVLIGHLCANSLTRSRPIYESKGLPVITPAITHMLATSDDSDCMFSMIYNDVMYVERMASYLKVSGASDAALREDGTQEGVALIYEESRWGYFSKEVFLKEARRVELKVSEIRLYDPNRPDSMESILDALRRSGSKRIFLATSAYSTALVALTSKQIRWNPIITGSDSLLWSEMTRLAGNAAEGIILCFPFFIENRSEELKKFQNRFQKITKRRPSWIAAITYDAVGLGI